MRHINKQLIFDLNRKQNVGLENFYISAANDSAVDAIKNWQDWPARKLLLLGPPGSGKSHLANCWVKKVRGLTLSIEDIFQFDVGKLIDYNALLIDDINDILTRHSDEKKLIQEKLFYLFNFSAYKSCSILMTSATPISGWGLTLQDLISRLLTVAVVKLSPPDDELLIAVLLKQFDDKMARNGKID